MKRRSLFFRKLFDRAARLCALAAILLAVAAIAWILVTVLRHGIAAITPGFLVNPSKPYGVPDGGIGNAILGTLLITGAAAVIAVPPAVAAGIFLAEFREPRKLAALLRFSANVMMGLPSVLIGLFVYIILVVPSGHFSGLAASAALAVIIFPVVMRTTEDMLNLVPASLREAGLALGLTRFRTTLRIVCASARKGLLTGILLALSRVAGETAPLLFTAMFADGWPSGYFTGPTPNLPVLITEYATNSPFEAMHRAGWGAALVVTLLVLALNIVTRILIREKNHE